MILDVARFIETGRPLWEELEAALARYESGPNASMTLDQITRFHYLYQRCASDLARLGALSGEPKTREYLESLVARGYAEVHSRNHSRIKMQPVKWLFVACPRVFRRHFRAFALTLAVTVAGCAFGAAALHFDPESKEVLMPFQHLQGSPADRVKSEESAKVDRLEGRKTSFSAQLMTHNIQVALFTLALGITWGVGPIVMLFYNGVILGTVSADYVQAGYMPFLLGWLLPHGVIEIPAILIAGQAGFVMAGALIGWGDNRTRGERLRTVAPDLITLAGLTAVMLVWAGIVESFLSQYHQPVIAYSAKIAFGVVELALLILYLSAAGRRRPS